jgi:uncharacterized repeat protein (TIGR04138 family)
MPPTHQDNQSKYVQAVLEVVRELEVYPLEAYEFVNQGQSFTVEKLHGKAAPQGALITGEPVSRHVSGQQLCEGLRDLALQKWGMMARTVLDRWNITSTFDFGRIVFGMIDNGIMSKTDDDCIDDFRSVYDFKTAFERDYRIGIPQPSEAKS